MRPLTLVSFVGFVLLMAGLWCPLIHVPLAGNFSAFRLNQPYGLVLLLMTVIGIIGNVFNKYKITQFAALATLVLVVVFYIAVFLKVKTAFSFIPFDSIAQTITHALIKFKWGWWVLFIGELLALAGLIKHKTKNIF
jgi:hypothetical protein